MDFATPIGIFVAFMAIMLDSVMSGGSPAALIAPSSMLLVFGGTIGVSLAGVLLKDAGSLAKALKVAILTKATSGDAAIGQLVALAETARREGLLALEAAAGEITDPFFRQGVEMAVDGTDPEQIREVLEREIDSMRARHRLAAKFFADMGGFAPTIGILGTVLGLVHVLSHLSTPDKLGPLIGDAFTATLWGVLSANVMWIPIANKLKRVSEREARNRELVMDGILAIQAGSNPRMLEQQLLTYLAPKDRETAKRSRAA
ncbi:MAG: flagellar motor protein [Acidimicrobiales bacterium]